MNSKVMFLWGMLILIICSTLLIIGNSKKDKVLLKLERNIKSSSKKYISDNNIKIKYNSSYVVTINDLINDDYIEDSEEIKKYCIKTIVVSKNIFLYEFVINKECDK